MSKAVKLADGVRFETDHGTIVADASSPDESCLAICSHAHADHLPGRADQPTLCSELTAQLAGVRDGTALTVAEHPAVTLLPSGHVAGSRAALIDDGDERILFTGDVCTRDRCYLDGFEPPEADVLVVEATYGDPAYVFPPPAQLEREIVEWLEETIDRPAICYGYSLGRAQKLQHLIARSDRERCLVSDAVAAVTEPIEASLGVDLGGERYDGTPDLGPDDALVLPSNCASADWVADLVEETDALQAGFSGWAIDRGYRFRRGFDRAFPLSDHCDFEELLALVEAVDPERVYTHHGFADELAGALGLRGYDARSLDGQQASLSQF